MRAALKAGAERLLLWGGAARVRRRLRARDVLVLAYHNVVPEGEVPCGDPSLHLPQRRFAAQLDALLATHEVVPLEAVLDRGPSRRPRVVITFDDAYGGAVAAGIPELARRGLPATVFVAPRFVGGAPFWWDSFSGPHGLPPGFREYALGSLRGEEDRVREWAHAAGHPAADPPPHACCATEADLRSALRHGGITLGAHTWSHANLGALEPAELATELARPLDWLRTHFDAVVPWLAYPYGLASAAVHAAAESAGYRGAFRVDGGWIPRGPLDVYDLPRLDVSSGLSLEGFRLRISGLLC